jgi:release factor glutamine methyltransferase
VNLKQALVHSRRSLRLKQIEEASLEGEILLRHTVGMSRASLFSKLEFPLDSEQEKALNQALDRRLRGEPTAYITGHREFYGLDFEVDCDVLIPRPESEILVEKAIELCGKRGISIIADIGIGSGAIAVSLAMNLPMVTIYGVDISAPALNVARNNCDKHHVTDRITLLQGNLMEPLKKPVDMIIANLPYIKEDDLKVQGYLKYEPQLALNGGEDGLDLIKEFCSQSGKKVNPGGCILMEIGQGQAENVTVLIKNVFPEASIEINRDLAGIERLVSVCLT